MRLDHRIARTKGTIETFYEDASVASDNSGLTVADMEASITAGSAVSITSQSYSTTNEELSFTVNFANEGVSIIKVQTTFDSSSEVITSLYKFRALDDGTSSFNDYV